MREQQATYDAGEPDPEENTLMVANEAQRGGFTIMTNDLIENADFTVGARFLWLVLLRFAHQKGYCFPGYATLSKIMRLTDKPIRVYMKELTDAGLVEIRKKKGYAGNRNVYILHTDRSPSITGISPVSDQNRNISGSNTGELTVLNPVSPPVEEDTEKKTQIKKTKNSTAPSTLGAASASRRRLPEEIATWRPTVFADAWDYFGKTGSVVKAAEAWDKIKPDEEMDGIMADAIEHQRRAYRWGMPDGRQQPDFVTWLNQQRWNDDPQIIPQARRRFR